MTHDEAIAEGARIVRDHTHTVFSVPQCAKVIAMLLPGEMLLAEAAETAKKAGLELQYHKSGCILAAGGGLASGWTRVRIGEKA